MVNQNKTYLGDGVYASFDGYQIWLTTLEGNRIALEPNVYLALLDYVKALRAASDTPAEPA